MSDAYRIVNAGVHGRAGAGFVIDRPHGSGDGLFILFHVPIAIRLRADAPLQDAGAGTCVLLTPTSYHWYSGRDAHGQPDILDNSWVHFEVKSLTRIARRFALPLNALSTPARPDELRDLIAAVRRETLRRERFWEERCSLLMEDLLLCYGRNAAASSAGVGRRALHQQKVELALRQTREQIHGHLQTRWTVAAMARRVHLSPSRFAALYTAQFGVAPLQDLVEARIAKACEYLTNTALQVKEVAALTGFESLPYFSRAFRARIGCAPNRYQNTRR